MNDILPALQRATTVMAWIGTVLAVAALCTVILERAGTTVWSMRRRRLERRYLPFVDRALEGDEVACEVLVASPSRYRVLIWTLLITPLIEDRSAARIARTRTIATAMSLLPAADRFLQSRLWWRRALALRVLGLLQIKDRVADLVAGLDDPNADVRAAALDALTDLRDPSALPAIVVRQHDTSLHAGHRLSALAAFGTQTEPFLLDVAELDPFNRLNYARALTFCGTEHSRAMLCRWTADTRSEVRAAAFEALARVGLDERAARLAIEALKSHDAAVRAMAAHALRGWTGPGDAASHLARHLGDTWPVAVRAARSLRAMGRVGLLELETNAARSDMAGLLARQMLWEESPQP